MATLDYTVSSNFKLTLMDFFLRAVNLALEINENRAWGNKIRQFTKYFEVEQMVEYCQVKWKLL